MTQTARRGFFRVGDRRVHYRMMGAGPPALFIHSSPTNSSFVLPDMIAQADRYTAIAFDTPGFGLSDPLPLASMKVADLADATAAAMAAFGLPPVPVFGTHSGAAIALELGYRHPERVTGLMLDGVPIFTREEVAPLHGPYFAPLSIDPLGGHYAATWTRFRDQSVWFPWCFREPGNLNEYDLAAPASTDRWLHMFFAAAAHYKPAYLAVTAYCEGAVEAAAGLRVPAVFTATDTDMLHPHLARLPALRAGQEIVEIGSGAAGQEAKRRLTGEAFARFGSPGDPPAPAFLLADDDVPGCQFWMDGPRAQFFRHAGAADRPVVMVLHDTPGSSLLVLREMEELARESRVIAPDLPGSGESETLGEGVEMADYAAAMWRLCDALGVDTVRLRASGFSASLAIEMARSGGGRCAGVAIDGVLLPTPAERSDMAARYAPPITIQADGSHWYRLWLMLRDSRIYWPWYDSRQAALRRVPASFDGSDLHAWTVEVMKQGAAYHHFLEAALRHDAGASLEGLTTPIEIVRDPLSQFAPAYGARLESLLKARA